MVFYFSGTGNSEFVATTLANFLKEDKIFIPDADTDNLNLSSSRIVFVFPVYSWGVPPLIEKFITSIPAEFWQEVNSSTIPVDLVLVCGDEVGLAVEMFRKILRRIGISLNSAWSVIMPNNYVLLPGFNVDSKEIENKKLDECKTRIIEIANALSSFSRQIDVVKGSFPALKSKLIFPLFKRWGIFPKKWRFTASCISCGKCAAICPLCNVSMKDGHPLWGSRCCSCLGCFHICPVHAVEYGKSTVKKGQYFFPLRKISSRNCHKK